MCAVLMALALHVQYRLGPLGFLRVQDGVGPGTGNLNGVRDQITALEWTRDNVAAFGGDPQAVTLFGESAGSISICILTVSPLAAGLFHRAIMESGVCAVLSKTGLGAGDSSDAPTAAELRAMPLGEIFKLQTGFASIDGWVLRKDPWTAISDGDLSIDSFLIGSNSYDGLAPWMPDSTIPNTRTVWEQEMLGFVATDGYSLSAADEFLEQYAPERYLTDTTGEPYFRASVTQFTADATMVCPSAWLHTKLGQLGKQAYLYHFSYGPSCSDVAGNRWPDSPYASAGGWASHTAELQYVFSTIFPAGIEGRAVPRVHPGIPTCDPMADDTFGPPGASARLATAIPQLWTSFAKTGVPTAERDLFAANSTAWPIAKGAPNEPVLVLSADKITIQYGLKDGDCALFGGVGEDGSLNLNQGESLRAFLGRLSIIGCCVVAVVAAWRRSPRRKPPAQPVKCENLARWSFRLALVLSAALGLVPWLAPRGALPFVVVACCGCALLVRRDPRLFIAASLLELVVGLWSMERLLVFSIAAAGQGFGHKVVVGWLSCLLVAMITMACTLGCVGKALMAQATGIGMHGDEDNENGIMAPMLTRANTP
jgi:carboxylesterase type B